MPTAIPQKSVNGMVRRRTLEVVECGARRHLMKIYALGIDLGKTVFILWVWIPVVRWWYGNDVLARNCWPSLRIWKCSRSAWKLAASGYPSWPGVDDSTQGRIHWRRPSAIVRFSLASLRRTIHTDKTGGLNGSLQHWLAVYSLAFQSPKSFADADLT